MAALLSVENVTRRFGGVVALDGVSFDVPAGEIVGLIGPNGAGKTTAFNVITRLYRPDDGRVVFDGHDLLRTPVHRVVKRGVARTFQNVALWPSLSVLDNVKVGAQARRGERSAEELLEYVGLSGLAYRPAAGLPFGTLKRIELARALASGPRLLLLDEPAGGLNHEEVGELGRFVQQLRTDFDATVLLVEHHMNLVMGISDRVYVLNFGELIAGGTPQEVQRDPAVIEAYLETPVPLLELEDVEARYGAIQALRGISLDVGERQVVSVLGANGAGKTTTLRAISATVRRSGGLRFDGKPLPRSPEAVARLGIAHVPEGRGTFAELSVEENLKLGAYSRRDRSSYASDYEELLEHFPWLAERRDQQAGTLSGGEQQMLALARAFMARPRLILVDEPSLGLAPLIVKRIFDVLRAWIDEHGMSALVVEQNANVALEHSERGYVLEVGRVAVEGTADELRGNESVRKSYLGY